MKPVDGRSLSFQVTFVTLKRNGCGTFSGIKSVIFRIFLKYGARNYPFWVLDVSHNFIFSEYMSFKKYI